MVDCFMLFNLLKTLICSSKNGHLQVGRLRSGRGEHRPVSQVSACDDELLLDRQVEGVEEGSRMLRGPYKETLRSERGPAVFLCTATFLGRKSLATEGTAPTSRMAWEMDSFANRWSNRFGVRPKREKCIRNIHLCRFSLALQKTTNNFELKL